MKKTVCVDVDGVLADYSDGWKGIDHFGEPIEGAVEFTKRLSGFADVLIYTTRCSQEVNKSAVHFLERKVKEWLDKHGFVYASIFVGQGKPIAAAYIDDRAIECMPQVNGKQAYIRAEGNALILCNGLPGACVNALDGYDPGAVRELVEAAEKALPRLPKCHMPDGDILTVIEEDRLRAALTKMKGE